jgi:hypothetical protein
MAPVFEHTVGKHTGFVIQSALSGGDYAVGFRQESTGRELPYKIHGLRLEQAKERAIRWAKRGGPMR